MENLLTQQCIPVPKNSEPLSQTEIDDFMENFTEWWVIDHDGSARLRREFEFPTFKQVAQFAVEVAKHADHQDHHPEILLEYGKATVTWWTHTLNGLHRNDFIMAAYTDDVFARWQSIIGNWDEVDEASDESFPASDPPGY